MRRKLPQLSRGRNCEHTPQPVACPRPCAVSAPMSTCRFATRGLPHRGRLVQESWQSNRAPPPTVPAAMYRPSNIRGLAGCLRLANGISVRPTLRALLRTLRPCTNGIAELTLQPCRNPTDGVLPAVSQPKCRNILFCTVELVACDHTRTSHVAERLLAQSACQGHLRSVAMSGPNLVEIAPRVVDFDLNSPERNSKLAESAADLADECAPKVGRFRRKFGHGRAEVGQHRPNPTSGRPNSAQNASMCRWNSDFAPHTSCV